MFFLQYKKELQGELKDFESQILIKQALQSKFLVTAKGWYWQT